MLVEEEIYTLPKTNSSVGIDLGINNFAILDNGVIYNNSKFTCKMEQKLKREQRKFSRHALLVKQKGTKLLDAKNIKNRRLKLLVYMRKS